MTSENAWHRSAGSQPEVSIGVGDAGSGGACTSGSGLTEMTSFGLICSAFSALVVTLVFLRASVFTV